MSEKITFPDSLQELCDQVLAHEEDGIFLRLLALGLYQEERGKPFVPNGTLRLAATWNWRNPMLYVPATTEVLAKIYRLATIDREGRRGRFVGSATRQQVRSAPKLRLAPNGPLYHVLSCAEMCEGFPRDMCRWCGERRPPKGMGDEACEGPR